jgi:cell division protein FtsW (lipid II flippase)
MGWGLSPVSPEGWAVTLVAIGAVVCVAVLTRHRWWAGLVVVVALLIVVFLKGTSPGGAKEWDEYQAQKDRRNA